MKRDVNLYLRDILENIEDIESFSKGLQEKELFSDKMRKKAIIKSLEIIGEAVKNIPDSVKNRYPNILWKKISGLRDVLSHAYFSVSAQRIFDIIKIDLPKLKKEIGRIKIE
jgi:uncharacterized protein with HEPN domain